LRGVTYKIGAEAKGKYISPSSPVFCNAKYRGGVRKTEGLENIGSNKSGITLSPCVAKPYRGSAHRARGLEYKQEHNPRFRLYRAAKTQGRRRKKGEDCLSGASSAAPDGNRSDKPKSPITAAALLGSFFSLLRRINK